MTLKMSSKDMNSTNYACMTLTWYNTFC